MGYSHAAKVISGTLISSDLLKKIKDRTEKLKREYNQIPGLVTILVGKNPASESYVRLKIKKAKELGFYEIQLNLPQGITEENLLKKIAKYNEDEKIHGILVQLPLPKHIDQNRVINAINPDKDVDAFHPLNAGKLIIHGLNTSFLPCTPAGIIEILRYEKIKTQGRTVLVIGRSNIVGKPIANLLLQKYQTDQGEIIGDAAVSIVHSSIKDLKSYVEKTDILILAAGRRNVIDANWIKRGSCVIDVGVNQVGEKKSTKSGKMIPILRGDIDYDIAKTRASYITPVPGGVGPMTIAMLMKNTLTALEIKLRINSDKNFDYHL